MTSAYNLDCNPLYRDLGCPSQCSANNEYAILDEYSKFNIPKSSILAFRLQNTQPQSKYSKNNKSYENNKSITTKIPSFIVFS
jgi:hypothetical protein